MTIKKQAVNKLPLYKTEGIILKSADLGQLDRLLTIYSRGYGKIMARAISARKRESKLRGYLEPFVYAKFLLAKSKTIDIITDIEPIDNFSQLRQNLESLAYAYYFVELVDKLIPAPERDEKVWALLKRAMEVLENRASRQLKQKFYSPSLLRGKISALSPSTPLRSAQGIKQLTMSEIKTLFEQKLLEFLGHGVSQNKKALEVIRGLAGEEIKSAEFLREI